ncbi:hypothetical protein GPECTOR_61g825 [Gonium pectorale]|uniref:PAP-associated domain-containing protein n=1 Tax=Gonium pectorale TaxID=33097 RepID=A0A150G4T6_GONPE|nr:hypothetical protein GPECTOR_61g825 [Gonium pectorale]|eukprot:KXZ44872.1 hypothetical protein GPECTOR_61g825 [Gonium pectorale]
MHNLHARDHRVLLQRAAAQLVSDGVAAQRDVKYLLSARIPLIKFVDLRSGIPVDLTLGGPSTQVKAWSVSQVASIHPAFGKLFRIVKLWAKAHSINDGASHTFNSWCLTLLVMFHLQRHTRPALLPPLHALFHDAPPESGAPRLLEGGREPDEEELGMWMTEVRRRAEAARASYGELPGLPLHELFGEFVASGGRMMRALLAREEPFDSKRTGISVFHGDYRQCAGRGGAVVAVEDPFNSVDNTARTFQAQCVRMKKRTGTPNYVLSVFERTAQRLGLPAGPPAAAQPGPTAGAPAAEETLSDGAGDGLGGGERQTATNAGTTCTAPDALPSASTDAPAQADEQQRPLPPLSHTLAFLFGPELLSRLPAGQCGELLGPELEAWARAALAEGRPAGEVHLGMLRRLGAEG